MSGVASSGSAAGCAGPPLPDPQTGTSARDPPLPTTIDEAFSRWIPEFEAALAASFPRHFTCELLAEMFGLLNTPTEVEAQHATASLLRPMWDLLDRGGKRWRPVLLIMLAEMFRGRVPDPKVFFEGVMSIAVLVELIHNASLVVDDVEDDSPIRRGGPAIHRLHSTAVAINAGNASYFIAMGLIDTLANSPQTFQDRSLHQMYARAMRHLHLGQGMDIYWRDAAPRSITEAQYLQMCTGKTGALTRLMIELLMTISACASDSEFEAFGNFAEAIAVSFQIQDDILNLVGDAFHLKIAQPADDIREGKRSLIVIHAMNNLPMEEGHQLERILSGKAASPADIQQALGLIKQSNSIAYARDVAQKLTATAMQSISPWLSQQPELLKLIEDFVNYLVLRKT